MYAVLTYLSALVLLCHPVASDHAVYISVVEITEERVQVKVFTDDLQNAIRNYDSNYRQVSDGQFCSENRLLIQRYFQSHLTIKINGQPIVLRYTSASKEGDSYWVSFDMPQMGIWQSIEVTDKHFMELFPTQANIIKIMAGKQRFCKLTVNKPDCKFPL